MANTTTFAELKFCKGGAWYVHPGTRISLETYTPTGGRSAPFFSDFNGINVNLIPADKITPKELPVYVRTWMHSDLEMPFWRASILVNETGAVEALLLEETYSSRAASEAARPNAHQHTFLRGELSGDLRETKAPFGCFTGDHRA